MKHKKNGQLEFDFKSSLIPTKKETQAETNDVTLSFCPRCYRNTDPDKACSRCQNCGYEFCPTCGDM